MTKKRLLSGIKPTGSPHIGNYFGMMKQLVDMQDDYEVFAMVADYHALNSIQNAGEMRKLIKEIVVDYLAVGLDPKKIILFKQSDISEHTELTWILDNLVTVPFLQRAHAFKDAEAKGKEVSVGVFNYPVLMAADILLYDTDIVPVGSDQKQHIEYTRDIAQKFNNTFGETFKLPKEKILESVATVQGIDGRKMSKSYNNTIGIFDTDEEIKKKVMTIVTDSSGELPQNVYNIHKLFRDEDDLKKIYEELKGKYKNLKELLADDIIKYFAPMKARRDEIAKDEKLINEVLKDGAKTAKQIAQEKLNDIKTKIGVK
ncbi:MAG: tryptophan--tRNA ligase [Candidatus Paceibacterota bacterium]